MPAVLKGSYLVSPCWSRCDPASDVDFVNIICGEGCDGLVSSGRTVLTWILVLTLIRIELSRCAISRRGMR